MTRTISDPQDSFCRSPTTSLVGDVLTILAAILLLMIVGAGGGYLLARLSWPTDIVIFAENPHFYWVQWSCRIVGAFCGQLLSGFVLGRFLSRISPRYVLAGFVAYTLIVVAINRGFVDTLDGYWLSAVGPLGAITQIVLQILAMIAIVYLGIWMGRKQRAHVVYKVVK